MEQDDRNANEILVWGLATRAIEGQVESGDLHFVRMTDSRALVAVVDGLGHGVEAAAAARQAVEILAKDADQSVISLVKSCHEGMLGTRGVVLSVAAFSAQDNTMT